MFELATNRIRLGEIAVKPFRNIYFVQLSRQLQATHSLTVSLGRLSGMLVSPLLEQSMEDPRHTQGSGQPRAPATSTSTSRQRRLGSMARLASQGHTCSCPAVTGHMVTVLAMVTTGAHMVSLGIGVRCHASLLTAASRLSLYRAGPQRGAGAGVRPAATRPASSRAQVEVGLDQARRSCRHGTRYHGPSVVCCVVCVVCCHLLMIHHESRISADDSTNYLDTVRGGSS